MGDMYETEIKSLNNIINNLKVNTQGTFVDVGSYHGWWANAASTKEFSKIIMIEPNLEAVKYCQQQPRFFSPRFEMHNLALSDKKGVENFYHYKKRERCSGLNLKENEHTVHKVETKSLDCFDLKDVSFIKIDAESHEYFVLKGAKQTLLYNDCTVVVEITENHRKVLSLLKEYGYRPVAYIAKSVVFKLNDTLEFLQNQAGLWYFKCDDFKIDDYQVFYKREIQRKHAFNYDRENPIWGDFIFQKEQP